MKMSLGGRSSATVIADETLSLESLCAALRVRMVHFNALGRLKVWHPYKLTFFKYLSIYVEEKLSTAEENYRRKSTGNKALPVLRSKHFSAVPNSCTPFSTSETLKSTWPNSLENGDLSTPSPNTCLIQVFL